MQKVKGWNKFTTKFNIKKLIEEKEINHPEKYGFKNLRDMKKFVQGRGEYDDKLSFKPSSYYDSKKQNPDKPRNLNWEKIRKKYNLEKL